jgi:hypothetical protein
MAWGPIISLILRALPDLLFLWHRRAEQNDKEAIHADVQEFRSALADGDGDRMAVLLERRMRDARALRDRRA